MGESIFLAGTLAVALAGIGLWLRLLRDLRGEAPGPAAMLGALTVGVGAMGPALLGLAPLLGAGSEPVLAVGLVLVKFALAFALTFVWVVFRANARWAFGLVLAGIGVLAVSLVVDLRTPLAGGYPTQTFGFRLGQLATMLPVAWLALESLERYRIHRRRLALGLTQRATVVRIALWVAGCAAYLAVCGIALLASYQPALEEVSLWLRGALYFAIAAALWLTFFPPRRFHRRLRTA